MKLQEVITQYGALRQAMGERFASAASVLKTFCRQMEPDIDRRRIAVELRLGQQLRRKETEQNTDYRRCRQPAQRNQQPAAAAIFSVVGANHSRAAA